MTKHDPTLQRLREQSRDPFREVLAEWISNRPAPQDIRRQAKQFPDRWAQAVAILGRLAGYSERSEVEVSGEIHHVHHLSDAELESRIRALDTSSSRAPGLVRDGRSGGKGEENHHRAPRANTARNSLRAGDPKTRSLAPRPADQGRNESPAPTVILDGKAQLVLDSVRSDQTSSQ